MTSPADVSPNRATPWTRIAARGVDARAFLQGQLSCDVAAVATGDVVHGLLLTPAGEVITSLRCEGRDEGVDLVVRSELADATVGALRRFLLRTRCTLERVGEATGEYATIGRQVELGEPGPAEFARGLGPHSFGQAFVDRHVSFTKGCFTGQELVGRLDARGAHVPFRLARVTGRDRERLDAVVRGAGPSGERALQGVTTLCVEGDWRGLAIVHRSLLGEATSGVILDVLVEVLNV
jgi:folate-binding Fe-S cluster repair protein YgfZ